MHGHVEAERGVRAPHDGDGAGVREGDGGEPELTLGCQRPPVPLASAVVPRTPLLESTSGGLDSAEQAPIVERILNRIRPLSAGTPGPSTPLPSEDPLSVVSIGALSLATGVPVDTLRTWERRYGFPAPIGRSDSSHRRYPSAVVERLRLAVRAIELGHKPSVALRATAETLRELLAATTGGATERPGPEAALSPDRGFVLRAMDHARRLDGDLLVQEFDRAWNEAGAMGFLAGCAAPLLRALGEAWSSGTLDVGQEHYASEALRDFLTARWRPMSERARGPRIVCATVTSEAHVLGLHMAATALSLAGARILFLGANTPPSDIVRAATGQRAAGIALSAAKGVNRRALEDDVLAIRGGLPAAFPIACGGAGFDPPPPGVVPKADLRDLAGWVIELAGGLR